MRATVKFTRQKAVLPGATGPAEAETERRLRVLGKEAMRTIYGLTQLGSSPTTAPLAQASPRWSNTRRHVQLAVFCGYIMGCGKRCRMIDRHTTHIT